MGTECTALWAWITSAPDGDEGIVVAHVPRLGYCPLVAGTIKGVELFRSVAEGHATLTQTPVRLVRFERAAVVAELAPGPSREDHLATSKARALELIGEGDRAGAVASMMSDLRKHPETAKTMSGLVGLFLTSTGLEAAGKGEAQVRKWVEDFL